MVMKDRYKIPNLKMLYRICIFMEGNMSHSACMFMASLIYGSEVIHIEQLHYCTMQATSNNNIVEKVVKVINMINGELNAFK